MKISVIGAGVMGARVTEVLIKGGHDVVMIDTNRDHATGSLNRIVADLPEEKAGDIMPRDLKEMVGHTPFEVLSGAVLGTVIGFAVPIV